MPFDSQGNFTRLHSWEQDRIDDIDIVTDHHDAEDDNFADGFNQCFLRSGVVPMKGNLNAGGFKVTRVKEATDDTDAVNLSQVETKVEELKTEITKTINDSLMIGDIKCSALQKDHGNWMICNGRALSREDYADLFEAIGETFGDGNGITTFNLPDCRGVAVRGYDNGRGYDSGRKFGSYQADPFDGVRNAIRIMKETGADALKLEGGEEVIETITKIIGAGMPVMGHLGLMPQSINKYGTYGVRAKGDAEAEKLIRDAHLLEEAGCFALVLEKIPADLAARVASELTIPVIGIGAGGAVDGQVLVVADMLGMTKGFSPRFLRRYADLHTIMTDAIGHYVADVKSCDFPNETEQY